jgi:hypothetical protein
MLKNKLIVLGSRYFGKGYWRRLYSFAVPGHNGLRLKLDSSKMMIRSLTSEDLPLESCFKKTDKHRSNYYHTVRFKSEFLVTKVDLV